MKISMRFVFVVCILAVFAQTTVFGAQEPKKESPVAVAPEPRYEFAPVPEGSEVMHDYVVQNKGTAPLIIEQVKTG
jgi:hypothetical protein